MKKTLICFLLTLFVVGQAFAQQQTNSTNTNGIITLDLTQPTTPASFELDANNVWVGTFDNDAPIVFNGGTFSISHFGQNTPWDAWNGFTYSRNADNTEQTNWLTYSFGNMAGGGIKTDAEGHVMRDENGVVIADPNASYLVAYWVAMDLDEFWSPIGPGNSNNIHLNGMFKAVGVYVNNSPWTYFSNISGSGPARALNQEGDFLRLIIHALDGNQERNGSMVVHYLAKFENGTLTQSRNWEWVDLSALGLIGGVDITMESTDNSPTWGMNTPSYFVMDRFTVQTVSSHIQALQEQILTLQADTATLNATIAELMRQLAECQAGGTSNVPSIATPQIEFFPNPTIDRLHIVIPSDARDLFENNTVELFDINGRRVFAQPICQSSIFNGQFTIDMSPFPSGNYILRIGNSVAHIVKQ